MKARTFSSILIDPKFSNIEHRGTDVDLSSNLAGINLKLPVISANMDTVTEEPMATAMNEYGGLGIIHRFMSIEENVLQFIKCNCPVGVSIGVNDHGVDRFKALLEAGATIFCVDVAHGHHVNVMRMLEAMRSLNNSKDITIIAGNVATEDAAFDLHNWGADIVKVGIGPGLMCLTRRNTGVGVPQIFAMQRIKEAYPDIPLIGDGGYRNAGDFGKALRYCDACMTGACLAGAIETPGKVYRDDEEDLVHRKYYKIYRGSSSAQVKGENKFVEGKIVTVPLKGHVKYLLDEIEQGIQTTFSYVGARNLEEYRKNVEFIDIDDSGRVESKI